MKFMKYRVFDKTTKQDITDKYSWVITPNGELNHLVHGDLIGYPNAMSISVEGIDELNKSLKAVDAMRLHCRKCVYEIGCTRDKDNEHKCPNYKRDAEDGGYYG